MSGKHLSWDREIAHSQLIFLYFILKGEGIFDVDGKRFPVSEGSIVRIAPNGKRAFKNTGSSEMLVLCVQYKANSFSDDDEPLKDAIMLEANVKL